MIAHLTTTIKNRWSKAREAFAALFIAGYLSALGVGLFCHTFSWNQGAHPLMYWVVWDMFCGWSAHECRMHVLAEGVSGTFYDVLPGPWGDFHPHGELSRHNYDPDGVFAARMATNVLKHTAHEDITRLIVIEENWAKKFNMPDEQWAARWDEAKDPKRYYTLRHILTGEGVLLQTADSWYAQQANLAILANPRIAGEVHRSQPFYILDRRPPAGSTHLAGQAPAISRFGSPF